MHKLVRRGRARCDAHAVHARKPLGAQLARAVEQMRRNAARLRYLPQPVAVGAVLRAYHEHHVGYISQLLNRRLPVRGGVAQVVSHDYIRELALYVLYGSLGVVLRKRGLRQHGDGRVVVPFGQVQLFAVVNQVHRRMPHSAFHLLMAAMPHKDDAPVFAVVSDGLVMHFGNQRACGVYHIQVAPPRLGEVFGRRAVRRKHHIRALRYLVHILNRDRALALQRVHHIGVVNYLMLDIDGRAETLQRYIHKVNRANHARAKPPWRSDIHFHCDCPPVSAALPVYRPPDFPRASSCISSRRHNVITFRHPVRSTTKDRTARLI